MPVSNEVCMEKLLWNGKVFHCFYFAVVRHGQIASQYKKFHNDTSFACHWLLDGDGISMIIILLFSLINMPP